MSRPRWVRRLKSNGSFDSQHEQEERSIEAGGSTAEWMVRSWWLLSLVSQRVSSRLQSYREPSIWAAWTKRGERNDWHQTKESIEKYMRNIIMALIAIIFIVWVLLKGLAHAWLALGVLKFGFIVLGFLFIGWLWGHFIRKWPTVIYEWDNNQRPYRLWDLEESIPTNICLNPKLQWT